MGCFNHDMQHNNILPSVDYNVFECLVDAMSSFGIKSILIRIIITKDLYWETAHDLAKYFWEIVAGNSNKIYKLVSQEDIDALPPHKNKDLPGNRKEHMIRQDGTVSRKWGHL